MSGRRSRHTWERKVLRGCPGTVVPPACPKPGLDKAPVQRTQCCAGTHEQSSCTENSLLEREKSLKINEGTKRGGWQIVIVTPTCIHLHPLISQGSQATGDNECSTIWHCPSSIVPPTVSATWGGGTFLQYQYVSPPPWGSPSCICVGSGFWLPRGRGKRQEGQDKGQNPQWKKATSSTATPHMCHRREREWWFGGRGLPARQKKKKKK